MLVLNVHIYEFTSDYVHGTTEREARSGSDLNSLDCQIKVDNTVQNINATLLRQYTWGVCSCSGSKSALTGGWNRICRAYLPNGVD